MTPPVLRLGAESRLSSGLCHGPKGETAPRAPKQPQLTHSTLFKARQPRVCSTTRIYRRPRTTKGTPIRFRRRKASSPPTSSREPPHGILKGSARAGRAAAAAKTAQRLAED